MGVVLTENVVPDGVERNGVECAGNRDGAGERNLRELVALGVDVVEQRGRGVAVDERAPRDLCPACLSAGPSVCNRAYLLIGTDRQTD